MTKENVTSLIPTTTNVNLAKKRLNAVEEFTNAFTAFTVH